MTTRGRVEYHQPGARAQILIDAEGIAGNRIDPEYRWVTVELSDARGAPDAPTFADDGLCFVSAPGGLTGPEHFEVQRAGYERELIALLEEQLSAREVILFDHTLRSEHEGARPPSYHVHCDYNAWSARTRLRTLIGEAAAERWIAGRFAIVNLWRPLVRPVERAPLGFVRPSSVAASDWIDVDIIFPDRRGQIRGLCWSGEHRWVYLSAMQPDEAALFCVYASEGVDGVPHAAIDLVDAPADARGRQSIESRAFVRLDS